MNLISQIRSTFVLSDLEKNILDNKINLSNSKRIFYVSLASIFDSVLHLIFFYEKIQNSTSIRHIWAEEIFMSHVVNLVIMLGFASWSYFMVIKKPENYKMGEYFPVVFAAYLLLIGVLISLIDQLITSAISPFLFTILLISVVFNFRPRISFTLFIIGYFAFHFLAPLAQSNADQLLSVRVNAISFCSLGIGLSLILWKVNLTRLVQADLIEKQNLQLQKQNQEKDKLFSIIAHDLRSPLGNLISISEMLSDEEEYTKPGENKILFESLKKSSKNMNDLLENLLEWSRLQLGKTEINIQAINVLDKAQNYLTTIKDIAATKKIEIEIDLNPNLFVLADSFLLDSIFRNLCSNAIKYSHVGGLIKISAQDKDGMAIIKIVDAGIGMNQSLLASIFTLGNKTNRKGTAGEASSGLGLILSKDFVEKCGGQIWAESEEGKGSTFYFSLPIFNP
ncbi:MAG: HAMP domain-containing histidine kinase [Bacteroidia bacterium]|nr:HAMP domain-containing histidine kinase [Bacteroidia bacterium]MCF8427258.1 HAMP domain-containing histidine kinase [Bacteroidia bacterium]MCF8445982.1 HAMP domain-containing histidine kinase [Bacteroidia bacterium]